MGLAKLLVANRGEIAIRIIRAAADLGITSVAIHPADDIASLHTRMADETRQLQGRGAAAYLDIDQLVSVAVELGCDSVHPGYGFLAENPAFCKACEAAGLIFVGPDPQMLELFGDKIAGAPTGRTGQRSGTGRHHRAHRSRHRHRVHELARPGRLGDGQGRRRGRRPRHARR